MNFFLELGQQTLRQVWHTLIVNWPFLLASILVTAILKVYLDQNHVAAFISRYKGGSVLGATAAAVGTPLCSCGTTAIVLGMMSSLLPWAPIVAFMVASPLTSPQELIYSAGLFGWPFALLYFLASIILGLLGGLIAHLLDRSGWLANQSRFERALPISSTPPSGPTARAFLTAAYQTGRLLSLYFLGFSFLGYLLNGLIPGESISWLFGAGRLHSIPLAATLGLPFYLNTEASLPLVRTFLDGGMSPGAAMAFLITGAGTSVGAIVGALTIARWRVISLVVATLWFGGILFGFMCNLLLEARLF